MGGRRPRRAGQKSDALSYQCTGQAPLTVGRMARGPAKLVRAERLDTVVWHALGPLLRNPPVMPHRHPTWAEATPQHLSGLEAHHAQWLQRRQRLERQDPRVLDADQAEMMTLSARQPRRQKRAAALPPIAQESRQFAHTRQQSIHWQQVSDQAATFRQWLGDPLEQLSFGARQAITRCLISKVVVTEAEVDVHFVRPFDATPQRARHLPHETEGTPGHFYRLRLAHFQVPFVAWFGTSATELVGIVLPEFTAPLSG